MYYMRWDATDTSQNKFIFHPVVEWPPFHACLVKDPCNVDYIQYCNVVRVLF